MARKTSTADSRTKEDTPFCLALLADFSGRGDRGPGEEWRSLGTRRRLAVGVKDLENLPGELGAEIRLPLLGEEGPLTTISFRNLGDFHPDRIFERLDFFHKLRTTRSLLLDPATFAEGASEVLSWTEVEEGPETPSRPPAASEATAAEPSADSVERRRGTRPVEPPSSGSSPARSDLDALIHDMVQSYIVPAVDPEQAELVARVDLAISDRMRAILHHPHFKELESAWRTLQFLVDRVEPDETLRLLVVDVSKDELFADLAEADEVRTSGAYRLLVDQSADAPQTLLIGDYSFDASRQDLRLLHQLARVARAAGAPFLAAAGPHFAGCESIAETPDPDDWHWRAGEEVALLREGLQGSSEAAYVGLALPRFLLRLPYGKDTDPVTSFAFEEFHAPAGHEQYLWGNSAAICACLLATAYRKCGWALSSGIDSEVTGIPMHEYVWSGEKQVTPCAETLLTDRAMKVLIEKRLMPVLSVRDRDAVQVARLQSIAKPAARLAGRWK